MRRCTGGAGAVCGQSSPASPIRVAGDPAQRSPVRHRADHDAAGLDLRAGADLGTRRQQRPCSEARAGADPQLADDKLIALQPPTVQVDVGLERRILADSDQAGHRRERAEAGAGADVVTTQSCVTRSERRAGQALRAERFGQPLQEPQAAGQPAAPGIAAGRQARQQQPPSEDHDRCPPERTEEHDPSGDQPPPTDRGPEVGTG